MLEMIEVQLIEVENFFKIFPTATGSNISITTSINQSKDISGHLIPVAATDFFLKILCAFQTSIKGSLAHSFT